MPDNDDRSSKVGQCPRIFEEGWIIGHDGVLGTYFLHAGPYLFKRADGAFLEFNKAQGVTRMFGRQLTIEGNTASSIKEVDGYRISLIAERIDEKPITQEQAQLILTGNIMTMFTQRMSFGGGPR
jgi:hypothetical protein